MRRREDGFTLVETLVGLMVLTAILASLIPALSLAMRSRAAAAEETRALRIAEARLAEAGVLAPLAAGASRSGADGAFDWVTKTRFYDDASPASVGVAAAFWVEVEVRWQRFDGRPRSVRLSTVKLGPSKAGR